MMDMARATGEEATTAGARGGSGVVVVGSASEGHDVCCL